MTFLPTLPYGRNDLITTAIIMKHSVLVLHFFLSVFVLKLRVILRFEETDIPLSLYDKARSKVRW